MRAFLLASLFVPSVAFAQTQVPAIQTAQASAAASATVSAVAPDGQHPAAAPAGMPPPLRTLSPSAPLNSKEKASARMAAAWRNHNDRPVRGEDGVLRWPFGASLPSVVCAPLQVCDLALQPGEVVNSIHVGDKARWNIMPASSGFGTDRTLHLIIKPTDAGLISSVLIFTDKRIYSVKLISTQSQWTPMTGFTYPETTEEAWDRYGATVTAATTAPAVPVGGPGADLDFNYQIDGSTSWKPQRVYASGGKTFVDFGRTMEYGTAPALLGIANDGGWFSSGSEQMLRYRVVGQRYIIDGLPDHFVLVEGVGGSQQRVDVRRGRP